MTLSENSAFIKDIHKVLKKHGLTLIYSKNREKLVEDTKHLEGQMFFFTKGEKIISLRGGESASYPNTLTVNFSRYKDTEDDGN